MTTEFTDQVAIVTGASSGIGRATAELLASRGARVAVIARSGERLRELADGFPERILPVSGDVGDPEAIEELFVQCERQFGTCQVLINNAGMVDPATVLETTVDRWDRMFAVNLRSAFIASRRALPPMIEQRSGVIINVSSISGVAGPEKFPGSASYCASKAALIVFTESLAVEVKDYGVRVNCVSPGSVDTPMLTIAAPGLTPSMTPAEVAETILFLASGKSRAINGQNLHVYSA